MQLLPVTQDYDKVSEQVRTFSATALSEMIAGLRPYVAEALSDPGGIHDIEPSRLVAYTQLLKLQSSLIKDLGLLYRVQDRPMPDGEEQIPASAVARILEEQAAAHAAVLAAEVAAAEARVREELASTQRLSLEAAKAQVLGQVGRLAVR